MASPPVASYVDHNNSSNIDTSENAPNNTSNSISRNSNHQSVTNGNSNVSTASSSTSNKNRNIIASHYQIAQKIGEGSFGIIFKGYDLLRSNQPVAIKFESRKSDAPQLKDEFRAYKILNNAVTKYYKNFERDSSNQKYLSLQGIPKVYYFGQEGYYNILIIQLLGPSLEDLFEWCGRKFSLTTVSKLAIQMIERLQFLHENNLIYRDIKPDNFLIGATQNDNTIYMVDYGMVKQYRDPVTHAHIPYRERKSLSGTARYMSINTHLGREQSRRDDLESLGNVFVYFLKGQLPWQGLKAPTNKLKYEKIGERKQKIPIPELCSGLPIQIADYIRQVRNLKFDEEPDYSGYIDLFKSILRQELANSNKNHNLDLHEDENFDIFQYDWMKLNDGQGWSWNKNKKINLNGYGSGVRHTNTKTPQQQQQQQQQHHHQNVHPSPQANGHHHVNSQNQQYATNKYYYSKSNQRSMSYSNGQGYSGHYGSTGNVDNTGKVRTQSASNVNERTGLLNNPYLQDNTGMVSEFGADKGWFSWLCCCLC